MTIALTYRGELRCFSCGRYLGEFESHPERHGRDDIHFLKPEGGQVVVEPGSGRRIRGRQARSLDRRESVMHRLPNGHVYRFTVKRLCTGD